MNEFNSDYIDEVTLRINFNCSFNRFVFFQSQTHSRVSMLTKPIIHSQLQLHPAGPLQSIKPSQSKLSQPTHPILSQILFLISPKQLPPIQLQLSHL